MICEECRDRYRSAARLETLYSTDIALRDLVSMVAVASSLLIVFSTVISFLSLSPPLGASQITFLVTAAASLTGVKMAYGELGSRYEFTQSFTWSSPSCYGALSRRYSGFSSFEWDFVAIAPSRSHLGNVAKFTIPDPSHVGWGEAVWVFRRRLSRSRRR